jgi:hypothetical protein
VTSEGWLDLFLRAAQKAKYKMTAVMKRMYMMSILLSTSDQFQFSSHELDSNEILQDQFGFKAKSFSK